MSVGAANRGGQGVASAPVGADGAVAADPAGGSGGGPGGRNGLLLDLDRIDLSQRLLGRDAIARVNPHRGEMAMLDYVVWHSPDFKQGVGLKITREDEFWVAGHFPGLPMLPGVIMVEAAAQLAVYLYNARRPTPLLAAFTRIDNCSFRSSVKPGHELYLLCQEVKWSRRGFVCDVQGITDNRLTFEARICGISIDDAR